MFIKVRSQSCEHRWVVLSEELCILVKTRYDTIHYIYVRPQADKQPA